MRKGLRLNYSALSVGEEIFRAKAVRGQLTNHRYRNPPQGRAEFGISSSLILLYKLTLLYLNKGHYFEFNLKTN
jgi:hypothetical protein